MKWGDRKCCKDLIKPAFPWAYSGTQKPVTIPVQRYPSLLHVNNKAGFTLFGPVYKCNANILCCMEWLAGVSAGLGLFALYSTAGDTSASYVPVPSSLNAVGALVLFIYILHF